MDFVELNLKMVQPALSSPSFCSNWTDENGIQSYSLYDTKVSYLGIVSFSMFY